MIGCGEKMKKRYGGWQCTADAAHVVADTAKELTPASLVWLGCFFLAEKTMAGHLVGVTARPTIRPQSPSLPPVSATACGGRATQSLVAMRVHGAGWR